MLPQDIPSKVCSSCGETKPLTEFVRRCRPIYRGRCLVCDRKRHKAWRTANRERWLAKMREWKIAHPAEMAVLNERQHKKARTARATERKKRGQRLLTEPRNTPEGRICSTCHKRRPWDEFGKNNHSNDGFTSRCTKCAAEYRQKNDSRIKAYGITRADYNRIVAEQNGECPICGQMLQVEWDGGRRKDHIDHDHVTGSIRGVLCNHCNLGLGAFHDSPEALRRAAEYIERSLRCQVSQGPVSPDDMLLTERDLLGSSLSSTS